MSLRVLVLLVVTLTGARVATADNTIATDSPPPPPPPQRIIAIDPPPSPLPRPRPPLSDRWTVTAQTGVGWLQIAGVLGSGVLIQPSLTRTFDRVELAVDYLGMDSSDRARPRQGATVHRLGGELRYQAARARVARDMTLDLVGAAGIGVEYITIEHSPALGRADVALGVVLRMLNDVDQSNGRALYGFELGARLIAAPRLGGGTDLGFIFAFGFAVGS